MADLRQCSPEFLAEFIALYQNFPCIWRIKSKEYSDRDKKRQAYEILVAKFKEIDVTANRETVVKKINTLRSVYRKELAKVNKSDRSGAGEYDIYKPSLWYYDLLHFLKDQETARQSRNTMDEGEESIIGDAPGQELEEDAQESDADTGPSEAPATSISELSTPSSGSRSLSYNTSRSQSLVRKRKGVPNDDGTTEVMALVGKKLNSLQAEDAFQMFGKHVANKLRNVHSQQNTFAQKLISNILFEAEMGSLTRHCEIVDMTGRPHTVSSQVGQYQSFSQLVSPHYVREQPQYTQEYQTIGQRQQVSSHIIPQQGEQGQQTQNQRFISQQAGKTHQISQHFTPQQTETLSEDISHHDRSSVANIFSSFQPI